MSFYFLLLSSVYFSVLHSLGSSPSNISSFPHPTRTVAFLSFLTSLRYQIPTYQLLWSSFIRYPHNVAYRRLFPLVQPFYVFNSYPLHKPLFSFTTLIEISSMDHSSPLWANFNFSPTCFDIDSYGISGIMQLFLSFLLNLYIFLIAHPFQTDSSSYIINLTFRYLKAQLIQIFYIITSNFDLDFYLNLIHRHYI